MNRLGKQFAFGSIYLVIIALITGGIYYFYFKPAPSCSDNKQNQKESGIDCGGPCIPCELKDLNLSIEEIKVFPAGRNQATLLAKVKNPSEDYGARFSYRFNLTGAARELSRELQGSSVISPQAVKYIVVPGLPVDSQKLGGVDLEVTELNWDLEPESRVYKIRLDFLTRIDKERVVVNGTLANDSASGLAAPNLTALLFDKQGEILNASITKLDKIEAFSQRRFTVFFPEIEGLVENLDPEKTQIFWEVE